MFVTQYSLWNTSIRPLFMHLTNSLITHCIGTHRAFNFYRGIKYLQVKSMTCLLVGK